MKKPTEEFFIKEVIENLLYFHEVVAKQTIGREKLIHESRAKDLRGRVSNLLKLGAVEYARAEVDMYVEDVEYCGGEAQVIKQHDEDQLNNYHDRNNKPQ